jgi:NEDD8-activating enzyme E1 regulatory subunit
MQYNSDYFLMPCFFPMLQLPESFLLKLDYICRKADIVLVAARSYGLTGLVRVSVKVLDIFMSKTNIFSMHT